MMAMKKLRSFCAVQDSVSHIESWLPTGLSRFPIVHMLNVQGTG